MKRRVRKNPELLLMDILENPELMLMDIDDNPMIIDPKKSDAPKVWRMLRKCYPLEKAIVEYGKIYPGSRKNIVRRNGAGPDPKNPKYKAAYELFKDFHGRAPRPEEIHEVSVPELGEEGDDLYFVMLGKAPAESYDANGVISGSKKEGAVYVHKYEGKRPYKAVSSDGKLIITLPGQHRVTRKKGEDQAWIHH